MQSSTYVDNIHNTTATQTQTHTDCDLLAVIVSLQQHRQRKHINETPSSFSAINLLLRFTSGKKKKKKPIKYFLLVTQRDDYQLISMLIHS